MLGIGRQTAPSRHRRLANSAKTICVCPDLGRAAARRHCLQAGVAAVACEGLGCTGLDSDSGDGKDAMVAHVQALYAKALAPLSTRLKGRFRSGGSTKAGGLAMPSEHRSTVLAALRPWG
jgi:hypothetical protein